MHTITESIHIDRPREQVWPYLVDLDKTQMWVGFEQIEQLTDGPMGKGTRLREVYRFLGKRMEMIDEVTDYEEGTHLGLRTVQAPIPNEIDQRLADEGDGTRVEMRAHTEDTNGFFGRLAEPVVERIFAREVRQQLQRLKDLCEAA